MYKYLLFDFDGTLIDTNQLIIEALNETSKRFLGRELTSEDLNSILGKYLDDQMRFLCNTNYREMVLYYNEFYDTHKDTMIREFPGVGDMLSQLKEMGCKTAIVSAKVREGIVHGLEHFKLAGYFDVIISASDIENNKPHPEPAEKALKALGAKAEDALFIGDSPYDILCGKNSGIKTVLVDWTIFPKGDILKHKPDFYINSPYELIKIIESNR